MGRSFCTTTQIDITKWYILPELFPKSKGKGFGGGLLRSRRVHSENRLFVGGQPSVLGGP